MNAPIANGRPRRRIWLWLLGGVGACLLLAALAVADVLTLSRDAAAMRRAVRSAVDADLTTRLQASVGPVILGGVRTVVSLMDAVPAEARRALAGVKSASIGVYGLDRAVSGRERSRILAAVDPVMLRRGWSRLVVVDDRGDTVLIYAKPPADEREPWPVCLAVCERRQLVIVNATLNLDILAELATPPRQISRR